jgi:prepilin-type N-terminal cleavage/methylation domain-containing protein
MTRLMLIKDDREKGFTLLEALIVMVVGGILIGATFSIYRQFMNIYQRQKRVIQIERELNAVQLSLEKALTLMPGRDIGYYSGSKFSVADLPSLQSESGPVKLGIVTPFKIDGSDAITIVYGRRDAPRMELAEPSLDVLGKGIARVAVPGVTSASELPFNVGDLMLLVGAAPGSAAASSNAQSESRLIKLSASPVRITGGTPKRELFEFRYDFCEEGSCGSQFPQLINRTSTKIFTIGSALLPINIVTFYLSKNDVRTLVMRNDGGRIISVDGKDNEIVDGKESFVGEADSIQISYLLRDNSERPTPDNPVVDWLNQVKGVRVQLRREIRLPIGNETASRRLDISFPIAIRTLE